MNSPAYRKNQSHTYPLYQISDARGVVEQIKLLEAHTKLKLAVARLRSFCVKARLNQLLFVTRNGIRLSNGLVERNKVKRHPIKEVIVFLESAEVEYI